MVNTASAYQSAVEADRRWAGVKVVFSLFDPDASENGTVSAKGASRFSRTAQACDETVGHADRVLIV